MSYYLDKLCLSNGLSKLEEQKLINHEYGVKLRALAKICNLNVYIAMNYSGNKALPQLAKRPYQMLEAGELLPRNQNAASNNQFENFLSELYQKVPSNPDFSKIMILRYYRLPISYLSGDWFEFYGSLREEFDAVTHNYLSKIQSRWNRDQDVLVVRKPNSTWLNERSAARSKYDAESAMCNRKYIAKAKSFGKQVVAAFTDKDYRDFIADQDNFICYYFPRYLKQFCTKYHLSSYLDADGKEACALEDEAFFCILSLVREQLLKQFESFWQKSIATELYGDNQFTKGEFL